jgi:hypothetical protein
MATPLHALAAEEMRSLDACFIIILPAPLKLQLNKWQMNHLEHAPTVTPPGKLHIPFTIEINYKMYDNCSQVGVWSAEGTARDISVHCTHSPAQQWGGLSVIRKMAGCIHKRLFSGLVLTHHATIGYQYIAVIYDFSSAGKWSRSWMAHRRGGGPRRGIRLHASG